MASYLDTVPSPEKVDEFSDHVEVIPSDDGDWAGITDNNRLSLRDDWDFEESSVAFVSEEYDHDFQFRTGIEMRDIRNTQESSQIRLTERKDPDANGIVEQGDEKYTLEERIASLARQIVNDGRSRTPDDPSEVTIEYTEHNSLDRYRILIKW